MAISRSATRRKSAPKQTATKAMASRISQLSPPKQDVLTRALTVIEEVDAKERAADERGAEIQKLIDRSIRHAEVQPRHHLVRDHFLLNTVAYKAAPFTLLEGLVQRWYPDVTWIKVHRALESINGGGDGYLMFMDAFRDAAFLTGVSYAQRQMPSWFKTFVTLDAGNQEATRQFVESCWRRQQEWAANAADVQR